MSFLGWLFRSRKSDTGYADALIAMSESGDTDQRETLAMIGCMNLGVDPFWASKQGREYLQSLAVTPPRRPDSSPSWPDMQDTSGA